MNIKRNILFTLEKRKKDGVVVTENIPIRMRVIYNGKRVEFTTGYRIDEVKWDEKQQKVKNGCTNKLKQSASEINADLLRYGADIQEIFKGFEVADVMPAPDQLRRAFNKRNEKEALKVPEQSPRLTLFKVFDEFTKECGRQNNWTLATYEKFKAVKAHLETFDSRLEFERFTEAGLIDYVNFLRDKEGLRNSTIGKQIGFLKWFLRWAFKKGYHTNPAYDMFRPKLKSTQKKVIFLTWDELTKFREFEIPKNKQYLERVRDVFLFQCFTGLRYSDVCNLKRSDVKENHIEVTTVKTADSLIIELNNHSKTILDKYKEVHFEEDKVLPVISNQKMNDYIKELCELAGIDEQITLIHFKGNERIEAIAPKYSLVGTHTGRRTFICNALALGIPVQVVMKWTGHSDFKSMKPYIDVADKIRANEMERFNGFGKY